MSIKEILKKVLIWRIIIILIALPALFVVVSRARFTNLTSTPSFSDIGAMWSNFDGLHYLDLAQYGYGYQHKTDMDYAFFPVYPWLISKFNIFNSYLISGLFVSHLCLVLAIYFLYKLILLDKKPKIAKSAILLLLTFPTAFFFGSIYTESIFLLITVLSFYFMRKQYFFLAAIFACIASATRVTGVLLWPLIIYEYWLANHKNLREFFKPATLWLLIPPIGLFSFMKFQQEKVGDPLFFIHIQSQFAERTTNKLILIYQVIFRYLKMLVFVNHTDPLFFTVLLEFLSACLLIFFLIFAFKRIRFSYWIYVLFSLLIPSLTGTFMSLPRFTLVLFPVFIYLADLFDRKPNYYKYIYYIICIILAIFSIALFTRGYFIA